MTRQHGFPVRKANGWHVGMNGKAVLQLSCGHYAETTWEPHEVPSLQASQVSKKCKQCPRG